MLSGGSMAVGKGSGWLVVVESVVSWVFGRLSLRMAENRI